MATLMLNGKVGLSVRHNITKSGADSFTYVREDTGTKLPPLTDAGVDKFLSDGTLSVRGADFSAEFVEKDVKVRVPVGIDEKTGKEISKNVPTGERYISAQLHNVTVGEIDGVTLTLEFRPDDTGRYIPKFTGTIPTGGHRGRIAAAPTDGDDLF